MTIKTSVGVDEMPDLWMDLLPTISYYKLNIHHHSYMKEDRAGLQANPKQTSGEAVRRADSESACSRRLVTGVGRYLRTLNLGGIEGSAQGCMGSAKSPINPGSGDLPSSWDEVDHYPPPQKNTNFFHKRLRNGEARAMLLDVTIASCSLAC